MTRQPQEQFIDDKRGILDHVRKSKIVRSLGVGVASVIALTGCGNTTEAKPPTTVQAPNDMPTRTTQETVNTETPKTVDERRFEAAKELTGDAFYGLPKEVQLQVVWDLYGQVINSDEYPNTCSSYLYGDFENRVKGSGEGKDRKPNEYRDMYDVNPHLYEVPKTPERRAGETEEEMWKRHATEIYQQISFTEGAISCFRELDDETKLNIHIAQQLVSGEYYSTKKGERIYDTQYVLDSIRNTDIAPEIGSSKGFVVSYERDRPITGPNKEELNGFRVSVIGKNALIHYDTVYVTFTHKDGTEHGIWQIVKTDVERSDEVK